MRLSLKLPALCFLFLAAVFCGMTSGSSLYLLENAGIARPSEPISFGIPLKMGELPNHPIGSDALMAINGVPAQFKVLSKWYDGSARWVLATFIDDFTANENKTVTFGKGGGSSAATQLDIRDGADTLLINTGAISVEILKGLKFNVINRIWRGSALVVDNTGMRGLVMQADTANGDSGIYVGRALTDSVIVEEAGPVRACVYVAGRFYRDALPVSGGANYPRWNDSLLVAVNGDSCCINNQGGTAPFVRFMTRLWLYNGLDEIRLSTVLHNTGGNGLSGPKCGDGGPWNLSFDANTHKTFSICDNRPNPLFFSSCYYDLKMNLGSSRSLATEAGYSDNLSPTDHFSFLQNRSNTYYLLKNGAQTGSGARGDGILDVTDGSSGLAAVYRYCWELFPKRLDMLGDTFRINLFPRDITPADTFFRTEHYLTCQDCIGANISPYRCWGERWTKCYVLPGGEWFRSDVFFSVHGSGFSATDFARARKNPIMPKFEDSYLHGTQAIGGFYSDTMRFLEPAGSVAQRVFERKRQFSGAIYDPAFTDKGWTLWYCWDNGCTAGPNYYGHMNAGDIPWSSGESNLHYDHNLGIIHSFLRTGSPKAWQMAEIMGQYKSNYSIYHHENGHPLCDGASRYENDDHGGGVYCPKASHHWTEGLGLTYALSGDPFVGEAFREGVEEGFWWFTAQIQLQGNVIWDNELRQMGWPLLNLINGYEILGNENYYDMCSRIFHRSIIPTEQKMGPGFCSYWSQLTGYIALPLVKYTHVLRPADSTLKDSVAQLLDRLWAFTESNKRTSGGILSGGRFVHPDYDTMYYTTDPTNQAYRHAWWKLDNITFADLYAYEWRFRNRPEGRTQAFLNCMSGICYNNKPDSTPVNDYSPAQFPNTMYYTTESKMHGKIGLNGRYLMSYEYDSLVPIQPGDGVLAVVVAESRANGPAGFAIKAVYPNPFNPVTAVEFYLPEKLSGRSLDMKVFDISGTLIYQEEFSGQKPGYRKIAWAGKDRAGRALGSGIYFMQLQARGQATRMNKLVLVK